MPLTDAEKEDRKRGIDALFEVIGEATKLERDLDQALGERDEAVECLSQMYYLVTGHSPEWSNNFGHKEALQDVGDALVVLKAAARPVRPDSTR